MKAKFYVSIVIGLLFAVSVCWRNTAAAATSFSVTPDVLNLSATIGSSPTRHAVRITSLGGTVNWRATVRTLTGSGWISTLPDSGSATPNQPSGIGIQINYGALGRAGIYQAVIVVADTATGAIDTVPVAVVLTPQQPRIGVSDTSILLTVAGGGAAPPPQSVQIINQGQGLLDWSIPLNAITPWLNVSQVSGRAGSDPNLASTVTFSLNNTAAQAMPSGVYQTLVPVSSPGASNDPQFITVTLQRVPGATPPSPGIRPNGLLFLATQGGAAPAPQPITVVNRGGGTIAAQLNATTTSGGNWLSVTPTGGSTATGPFTVLASANPGTLGPGIYRGTVRATFSAGAAMDVEAALIVRPRAATAQSLVPSAVDGCTPTGMELISNSIGNGVSVPTSFPKVLVVNVVDSCGESLNDATVVATAQGATIPMQFIGSGTYSGTWVPLSEGSATMTFTALHPTFTSVTRSYTVTLDAAVENRRLPVLFANGVVENAGFTPRQPLAPGSIVALFGSSLAPQLAEASQIPLERDLAGVSVRFGNVDAPLYRVAADQINAQVPLNLQPGATVPIVVNARGLLTAPQNYFISPAQPGVVVAPSGLAAVRDAQNRLITLENPAHVGDVIQIFALGLGKTDPAVDTGAASPPSSTVVNPLTVLIGGIEAPIQYQGLAPGFVGLYQVNVIVPAGVSLADSVPIVFRQNGVESNSILPAPIPIR